MTAASVGCNLCPILASCRTKIVDGSGDENPKVVFIAEAPGEHEDETGIPFVGKTGQLLRGVLGEAGLRPTDYYFTSAVRCRPPKNRNPHEDELDNCSYWLEDELTSLQAPYIVLVGKYAEKQWSKIEGNLPFDYSPQVTSILHPSYVMRTSRVRSKWEDGIRRIASAILHSKPFEVVTESADGWTEGIVTARRGIGVDTETVDLEEGLDKEMVMWQASDGKVAQFGTDLSTYPNFDHIYLYNAKYDAPLLGLDLRRLDKWDDAQLMAYVLREKPVGLKELGPKLTGIPMSSIKPLLTRIVEIDEGVFKSGPRKGMRKIKTRKEKRNFREALQEEPEKAITYGLTDAVVTARLGQILSKRIQEEPKLHAYYAHIEKPIVPILVDMEQIGALIDPDVLVDLDRTLTEEMRQHEELTALLLDAPEGFNLRSGQQLANLLIKNGLELTKKTPSGGWAVDETTLLRAFDADKPEDLETEDTTILRQSVLHVLRYREYSKLKGTYVDSLLEGRDSRGRVHARFNQMVADTNRFSSSDPNFQNIPIRGAIGTGIRRAFVAPPGNVIVKADMSALELRIFAHITQDQDMMWAFQNGMNPHDVNAKRFGIPRTNAKNFIFAFVYGAEEDKAAAVAGVPVSQVRDFLKRVKTEMPSLERYRQYIDVQLASQGYVETLFGWRNYYPNYFSPIRSEQNAAKREAGNMPIQGTASGLVKLFMIEQEKLAREYGARIILQVHDETDTEVKVDAAFEFAKRSIDIAAEIGAQYLTVPLVAEIEIGPSWGDLQKVKFGKD